jgi:hypothetical protein
MKYVAFLPVEDVTFGEAGKKKLVSVHRLKGFFAI